MGTRAIAGGGGLAQRGHVGCGGQVGHRMPGQRRHGVGHRVDACRQVDPLRPVTAEPVHRGIEIAAVIARRAVHAVLDQ
ncbi:hypothetical protein ACSSV4_003762 [Roseovarius sp. MBR-154]